jgi:hypothetical protein
MRESDEREGDPYFATDRMWDYGEINPTQTRACWGFPSPRRERPDPRRGSACSGCNGGLKFGGA